MVYLELAQSALRCAAPHLPRLLLCVHLQQNCPCGPVVHFELTLCVGANAICFQEGACCFVRSTELGIRERAKFKSRFCCSPDMTLNNLIYVYSPCFLNLLNRNITNLVELCDN